LLLNWTGGPELRSYTKTCHGSSNILKILLEKGGP